MHLRSSEALGAKPQERDVTKAPPAKRRERDAVGGISD